MDPPPVSDHDVERLKPDRCPLRIGARIDQGVDNPNRVQTDIYGVLGRELHPPNREPVRPVRAAEGVHTGAAPLQASRFELPRAHFVSSVELVLP